MFDLELHGADTYVGRGPQYPWGGLYGGQIVAQALAAAARTVMSEFVVHSLRAYFIRRGNASEPIRFEVDRIRNGRSFVTRRVVARQAVGAILNLEASFQRVERSGEVQTVYMPPIPAPDQLRSETWTELIDRRWIPEPFLPRDGRDGAGRVAAWMRMTDDIGDPAVPEIDLLHRCWFAYLSDDLATDAASRAYADAVDATFLDHRSGASLDHTVWFHRAFRADEWHLHDVTCHRFVGNRGLAIGHVFTPDGAHVATFAQEALQRDDRRHEPTAGAG